MISHKHRCVFVHLPKCGGQSVEDVFIQDCGLDWSTREPLLLRKNENPNVGPPWLAHLTYKEYLKYSYISEDLMDRYYKFTVVRNPYDRVASIYKYLGYNHVVAFEDFVKCELDKQVYGGGSKNYFFKPQRDFITNDKGVVAVDKVIKLENIEGEIQDVMDLVGIRIEGLPHVNASPGYSFRNSLKNKIKHRRFLSVFRMEPYKVDWTPELRSVVRDIYSSDFEAFGY